MSVLQSSVRRVGAGALAAILAGLCAAPAPAQTPAGSRAGGPVTDAIRLQKVMKKRYQELILIMAEVSRNLEATDPDTAAAISAAAQRAEAALIANDMDKVIGLLQAGLIIPADVTQAKVILRLREVLNALRGEDGLEWRLFLLQELQQQLADLALLIQRQQLLERKSAMLAFGERMRAEITDVRGRVSGVSGRQEVLLSRTRRLSPSPAAMEFAGVRQGIAGLLRRFDTGKDSLWNPTPPPDQMARNVVAVRRYHAETAQMRTDMRSLLNREVIQRALAALPPDRQGLNVVESIGRAADELYASAKAMVDNDLKEGHLALLEAKAQLEEALHLLDETVQAFSDVKPAVKIAADQKEVDDATTQLEPAMRKLFPAGLAAVDDSPSNDARVAESPDRLEARPTHWAQQSPVLLALDPVGTAARQQRALERLQDWSTRLEESLWEIDRLKDDPRYPAQQKDQQSIVTDLRAMLDVNRRRAETVEDDAELTGFFSLLRVAMENAADCAAEAAAFLGNERPAQANPKQNEVIHLLTTVRERIGPELKMDKNKYAMNEQMLARIQRMIIKERICRARTQVIWEKRPAEGTFGRTERLRIEAVARIQGGLEADFKICWQVMNTAHNVGFGLFPPEARILLELARTESEQVEKRLLAYDVGPETQQGQDVVLERLQAIATLLGPGFAETPPEMDRKFTYDSFISRMSLHRTRINEIGLLVTLQEDINRRTAQVEKARRSGKITAAVEQEAEQLRQLQEHVRQGLLKFALADAASWMRADFMPTQYGGNPGGAKQGQAAPAMRAGN